MIAIERAETACEKSKIECHNHFREVTKMVTIGSSAERGIIDIKLTRYACYLIAQNGDPRKDEIAFAQSYLNPYSSNRFMVCIACKGRSRC